MNEAKEDIGKEKRKKRYKNKSAMELTVSGKKWLVLYFLLSAWGCSETMRKKDERILCGRTSSDSKSQD